MKLKCKVGDFVEVTLNSDNPWDREVGFELGEIVRVTRLHNDGEHNAHYRVELLDGSDYWWMDDTEVKPYKKRKERVAPGVFTPLNDGSNGFRFNTRFLKGMVRIRKKKKRYEITKGKDMTGFHFGRFSVYFSKSKNISW